MTQRLRPHDITLFTHYDAINNNQNNVTIPHDTHVKVQYVGTIHLQNELQLSNVLYVPDFQYNLVSVHRLCRSKNVKISFVANIYVMQEPSMKPLLLVRLKYNL